MMLALADVARTISAAAEPPAGIVSGWSVDSRTSAPGDLFFALRGPNHDGHNFVADAVGRGASAAVVDRPVAAPGLLLPVHDTLASLHTLAAWARRQWGGTVVGVTGSAGKTTTKDIIARLLAVRLRVGKTTGNLNNHVGLPLSILRLPAGAEAAVLELGMNHAGEIAALSAVARPDIGVVTNVGYAHLENFDSIDGIALAKRELIEALPAGGTAVLNADDWRVAAFASVHPGPVMTFGFSPEAAVRAVNLRRTESGALFEIPGEGVFETALEGRHAVLNVLAGVAVARLFGIPPGELREAIRTLEASPMRGRRMDHHGIRIIDDCYNANPDAVRAMLEILRDTPARRRIAVLGEMLELGRRTETLHQEIGRYVAACGVDVLVGIRGAARQLADAAVAGGLPLSAAYFFPEPEQAGDCIAQLARPGDVILFKGSRGSRVERALVRFLSHGGAAAEALAETGGGDAGSAARGTGPAGEAL